MEEFNVDRQKSRFKDHVLTEVVSTESTKVFNYAKQGTVNNSQRWIIDRNTLIITGNNDSAVYEWQGNINLKFLAECNLDYFSGKCEADKVGCGQEFFDSEYAQQQMLEIMVECVMSSADIEHDGDIYSLSLKDKLELYREIIEENLDETSTDFDSLFYYDNINEAVEALSLDIYEFAFGSDGWEYGSSLLSKTLTPYLHLAALRSAYEKYGEVF